MTLFGFQSSETSSNTLASLGLLELDPRCFDSYEKESTNEFEWLKVYSNLEDDQLISSPVNGISHDLTQVREEVRQEYPFTQDS